MKRYFHVFISLVIILLLSSFLNLSVNHVQAGNLKLISYSPKNHLDKDFSESAELHNYSSEVFVAQGRKQCWFFGFFCNPNPRITSSRPAATRPAGRRGRCSVLSAGFRALIPISPVSTEGSSKNLPENIKNSLGFTISPTPTFWFYLPPVVQENSDDSSTAKLAEFMIQDEQGNNVLEQPLVLDLQSKQGLVSFTLPREKAKNLDLDKSYHWYFSIICDVRRPSRNPNVDGWVQRENPSKQQDVTLALQRVVTKADQVAVLAEKNLWYDAITSLVTSRCQQTDRRLDEYWLGLLKEVGLKETQVAANVCAAKQRLQLLNG